MARDLRNIGSNRNNYPDVCYLYDSIAVENNKLVEDVTPICRFRKKDVIPFQWQLATINGIVTTRKEFVGTVESCDHLEMLRPDMYVVDQTGSLFIVVSPVVSDDANKSKVIGTRPSVITRFTLKGCLE